VLRDININSHAIIVHGEEFREEGLEPGEIFLSQTEKRIISPREGGSYIFDVQLAADFAVRQKPET
jgi:hypothetical protein